MYDCMKTLRQVILENMKWSSTIYIYKICAINKWDQPVPVIFIVFFKIKIAIIKKKSNPSHLNTNQKPFANNACFGFS